MIERRRDLRGLGLLLGAATSAAALMGCAGEVLDGEGEPAGVSAAATPSHVHLMPLQSNDGFPSWTAPAGAHLSYFGGPVISSVKAVPVYWTSAVNFQTGLHSFYAGVTNSTYLDWLSEYDTPTQSIGRGTATAGIVDPAPPAGTNLTDAQIQAEINRLINAGTVPAPDANTLYMMHFPPGISITDSSGARSCAQFCAYHGTFTRSGAFVYYGVIPDLAAAGCAGGCGTSTTFNNTTSVSSHELIEAVTDAAVGVATTFSAPLAWYDPTNGEIGDICNGQQGSVLGGDGVTYNVQQEFSNQLSSCIVSKTAPANDFSLTASPGSQTVTAGGATTFSVATAVTSGSAQTVSLTVTGLPTGTTGAFNPTSVTAGAGSTLSLGVGAATAAGTYALTLKGTGTAVAHTALVSLIVNGAGGGGASLVVNGGFETGTFTGWTQGGGLTAVIASPHTGTYSARVGHSTPNLGNSIISQNVSIPATGTTTLTLWFRAICQDTFAHDQQKALILDATGTTVLKTIFNMCTTANWTLSTTDLTPWAGKTIQLQLLAHDNGVAGTGSFFFVDDVVVNNH
jgi:hypothetical protein